MTTRLITGATGFVGGAIALELLERTDDPLVALVRGDDAAHVTGRLHKALTAMAEGYGKSGLAGAIRDRTTAVRGDISVPGCRVGRLSTVDEVWHCAASLRYEEKFRAEIETHNITGTENVVALTRELGAGTLNYFSTAYVAGTRRGEVLEEAATDLDVVNNVYEETKVRAESLVRAAAAGDDVRIRILRPSIVIGHPVTRWGTNWSGMYGFARQVRVFRKVAAKNLGTFLAHARVQLLAEPDCPINLVPIDMVARNAVTVCLSDSPETYFHLVNANTITVRDAVCEVFDRVGLREPRWVDGRDGFTSLDETLDRGMDFYRSYLRNEKHFGLANTDAVCGREASVAPLDRAEIGAYVGYFLSTQPGAGDEDVRRVVHPVAV
jgi:nucleoside-diphosphate-sugar epimerase